MNQLSREQAQREVEQNLRLLTEVVRSRMHEAARSVDPSLSLFGLKVLQLLKRFGPLHSGAVAELLMVDKSVISRQSRQLEALGLIEVQPDPADGRARVLVLTPAAAERVTAVQTGIMLDPAVLGSWSTEDLHRFAGYLARLGGGSPGLRESLARQDAQRATAALEESA
ncbi:MarR family winged helix-turn-helix transcriptional regulator [Arthrobacter koreensis]|uniref:MarR family winged helix-turn-helix transcriptional regulator n=1 Tax=Arthrobacter koreensis TaxID=199136 RepID=UPI002DBCDD2B|nr:MarR family transcriptional regulator [Arthrobacter koreensis]MEB7504043.1 MarR family transcriptional regulator [Arthrobacter koreensis]